MGKEAQEDEAQEDALPDARANQKILCARSDALPASPAPKVPKALVPKRGLRRREAFEAHAQEPWLPAWQSWESLTWHTTPWDWDW